MRTRNCVIILLIVALAGSIVTAGQQQTTQRKAPETRLASCIVRITTDPAIVPLDPATVQGLLHSSAVAGNAVREVLHLDAVKMPPEAFIEMEWLNESSPRRSPSARSSEEAELYANEMMRGLERIYAPESAAGDNERIYALESAAGDKQDQPLNEAEVFGGRSTGNPPARSALDLTQRATIRLSIHLPEGVPPAAEEFLAAVIQHLTVALRRAYESYVGDLDDQLAETRHRYSTAVEMLDEGTGPETARIKEQLNTVVDLSALKPEMPISEAVEFLRKSVQPPLNIVVLWNDLTAFLPVEPTTPINIGGMQNVELGTGLGLLVKGLPASDEKPIWRIKGDAIVIGTAATLGEPAEPAGQPKVQMDMRALATQANELKAKLRELELSLAGQEARRKAISEQILQTQSETQQKLGNDEVTRELESLVQFAMENFSNLRKQAEAGNASTADVDRANENLTRARIELAKRREELSKQVGGGQLEQLTSEMGRLAIDRAEKEAQKGVLSERLAQVQRQLAQVSTFDPTAAQARVAREALDILARRAAELQMRIANLQQPMVTMIGAN